MCDLYRPIYNKGFPIQVKLDLSMFLLPSSTSLTWFIEVHIGGNNSPKTTYRHVCYNFEKYHTD